MRPLIKHRAANISVLVALAISSVSAEDSAISTPSVFKTVVDQLAVSENLDFATCLRDIYVKFRLHEDHRAWDAVSSELSANGWKISRSDRSMDITLAQNPNFKNFRNPVSLHVVLIRDENKRCATLSAYVTSQVKMNRTEVATDVFTPGSAWSNLILSTDISHRINGYTLIVQLRISYQDLTDWSQSLQCDGYDFQIAAQRDALNPDQVTIGYRAASGLDAAIDPVTGKNYPGSGRVLEAFRQPNIYFPPGEPIVADGEGRLFRYTGSFYTKVR